MRFVAGRGAVAERLVRGTALAELLAREPPAQRTAGRDAGTEQGRRQCESAAAEPAGRLARAPLRSKCAAARLRHGTELLWSKGADNTQASPRSTSGQQSAGAAAGQWRWQKARAGAGRQILSDSPSDLAITSAAQVLPYVFTAVRGISQSC